MIRSCFMTQIYKSLHIRQLFWNIKRFYVLFPKSVKLITRYYEILFSVVSQ